MGAIYEPILNNAIWSYSRISAFNMCKYSWYMKYIKGFSEIPMFYSSYGLFMHELIEDFYRGKPNHELYIDYVTQFSSKVEGERPVVDGLVEKYFKAGAEYIKNIQPFPFDTIEVELSENFNVGDLKFCGRIDYVGERDGDIYIVDNKSRDLKPRSGRAKPTLKDAELDEMLKQLYIYSIPIKNKYGSYPKYLCFNCFKSGEFIKEPFKEEKLSDAINWASDTVNNIKNEEDFSPSVDYFKCKYLCGLHDECEYWRCCSNS